MMKSNKEYIIKKLQENTTYTEQQCIVINSILEDHFIIGHNNKKKIMDDFMSKLEIDEKQADELYNTCAEIIVNGIFHKN